MASFAIPLLMNRKLNIPQIRTDDVAKIQVIGSGSFGTVHLVDYQKEKRVLKILNCDEWDTTGRKFIKEAGIMHKLMHRNIATLGAICLKPFAILMQYCCFDFNVYGQDVQVHSLDKYLQFVDNFEVKSLEEMMAEITKDFVSGLTYLHENNIAHRDLKPSNILVTNRHYSSLQSPQLEDKMRNQRIICLLSDFGEARSSVLQTQTRLATSTTEFNKGLYLFVILTWCLLNISNY